jgi:hypothetical protein
MRCVAQTKTGRLLRVLHVWNGSVPTDAKHERIMLPVDAGNCRSRDLLSNRKLTVALFWLPVIAMVISGTSVFGDAWRAIVWTAALSTMGAACIVNAARCGRVHCYITGPFFLLMAVVTLSFGLRLLPLGENGWNVISVATLVGAICLCCVPELFLGKYRKGTSENGDQATKGR